MAEAEGTVATQAAAGENVAPEAGAQNQGTVAEPTQEPAQETPEQRRARFEKAIGKDGEFADLYQQGVDNAVKTRLARERARVERTMAAQQPVLDLLMARYGTQDLGQLQEAINKDASWWQAYADSRGISEQQAREQIALQAEVDAMKRRSAAEEGARKYRERMDAWSRQAQEVQAVYPEFDLQVAAQNEDFIGLLNSGVNMRTAYEVINMTAIKTAVAERATKDAEARLTANIQANGARPVEGGTSGQPGATVKMDPGKMTKEEMDDIMARVARGEHITFG